MRNFLSPCLAQLKKFLGLKTVDTPSQTPLPPKPPTALTGMAGENAAAAHIQALGWRIVDRNWRHASLELDIVAFQRDARVGNDIIVFVEVKTRTSGGMTNSLDALTPTKQARLIRAARHWLAAHNAWDKPCRFDLAAVTAEKDKFNTELFHNVIELGDSNDSSAGRKAGHSAGRGHSAWQPW